MTRYHGTHGRNDDPLWRSRPLVAGFKRRYPTPQHEPDSASPELRRSALAAQAE